MPWQIDFVVFAIFCLCFLKVQDLNQKVDDSSAMAYGSTIAKML